MGIEDVFGQFATAAVTIHEMVTSLQDAGFSREEAIFITLEIFKTAQGSASA